MTNGTDLLDAATSMGAVTLHVADLDAMTAFYRDGVGLAVLSHGGGNAVLGHGGAPVVALHHVPGLKHAPAEHAGLFHTAVLFEHRADLAAAVYSVARRHPAAFTGSADHLVSEAFYFDDPEGNGLELYWDRPREQWSWDGGRVRMASLRLDPNRFLSEHLAEPAAAAPAPAADTAVHVGHVHLKVGDVETARRFYVDVLGFEVTAAPGGQALFVSAGGYHHHVAMNTWLSRGAGPRTPALGLGQVVIEVPSSDAVGAVAERLRGHGIAYRHDGAVLTADDPWDNLVQVHTPAA
ncbi:catechol 2,3-dioxygenase [Murinocardiopsis flavida]|uniref:Catechol 2,3-dioxygenase n=1 Tax=Murinocardiopsis flavida TaxID=645275 RepID=A0A2P8D988_9ACTN|nr:VOC family protein [Murinocardiopsis flavida]PSK93790.1 catechol 2,3-dioxygenase [Murinocardiopsis flavida]